MPAEADEADAINEPGKADNAKVHKANEAADEADAEEVRAVARVVARAVATAVARAVTRVVVGGSSFLTNN
jgi:hypothetical protein